MSDDVVDLAGELGRRIAADRRVTALKAAMAQATADSQAMKLQEDYARAVGAVHSLEEAGKPIEPEQKRRLALLAECVRLSPPLQRLLRAQQEFSEMWEGVQHAIGEPLDAVLSPPDGDAPPDVPAGPGVEDAPRIIRPS